MGQLEERNETPAATHVFHRYPAIDMPMAVGGFGPYLIDESGKRYLDASSGAAVSCLGHNHPAVIEAIKKQLDQLAFAHTSFFTSRAAEELAGFLARSAPGDLDHCYFLSSGSEAIEAALKLARQYYVEKGESKRSVVISRRQSYHGNTLGALAAGGNLWRREQFGPLLTKAVHISPCYAYRDKSSGETEEEYGRRIADELETAILDQGPENVMCFLAETVGGATLGAVPPVPGYFRRVREICDKYGVLLILDEVMCGMGRTGTLFAYEQEGTQPDIVAIAKGLGGGYQPIAAIMTTDRIFDAVVSGSGFFQHGHTYTGHVAACAAALAVQKTIERDNLLENVRLRGQQAMTMLTERFGNHHNIGDIRGRGLFMALEFVSDRVTQAPIDPARRTAARLKRVALENGLICYPMGGLIDGKTGDHVLLAPPFIVEEQHLEEMVDKLAHSVGTVLE
ncbi:MAG: aspartate aminotransferase family protein [Rhizobiaceae bacterium]